MSRWKILAAIIRGRQIGLRVLAGLRNVLRLQRSPSDFRRGGGVNVRRWPSQHPQMISPIGGRLLLPKCDLLKNTLKHSSFDSNPASLLCSPPAFAKLIKQSNLLAFQSRMRRSGITVRRSPTRVLHRTALFTFYLHSRRTRCLPGILSGGLTSFYLQDKGSWSGSYCTMIHLAPNIHKAAEDTRQLRPLCQINKLGNLKATGCFIAIFGPIFLKPSGCFFFFFLMLQLFVSFFGLFQMQHSLGNKGLQEPKYSDWREHC